MLHTPLVIMWFIGAANATAGRVFHQFSDAANRVIAPPFLANKNRQRAVFSSRNATKWRWFFIQTKRHLFIDFLRPSADLLIIKLPSWSFQWNWWVFFSSNYTFVQLACHGLHLHKSTKNWTHIHWSSFAYCYEPAACVQTQLSLPPSSICLP